VNWRRFGVTFLAKAPEKQDTASVSQVTVPHEIDLTVLSALEARLGRDSMVGLITAHRRHGLAMIERLKAMKPTIDRDELRSIGHQIVGSCGSIGLNGLSRLGGLLEDEAPQASVDALEKLVASTLEACQQAQTMLAERYPEVSA
jgi:HPt (histidine-containing phosphotransfer) domain-containing protein